MANGNEKQRRTPKRIFAEITARDTRQIAGRNWIIKSRWPIVQCRRSKRIFGKIIVIMKNKIKKFMLENFRNHLDDSNCLVMTSLAEEAAIEFQSDGNFLEECFEIAFDVQEILRRKNLINT